MLGLSALAVMLAGVATAVSSPAAPAPHSTYSVVTVDKAGDLRNYYISGATAARGGEVHGLVFNGENEKATANVKYIPRIAADGVNLIDVYVTEYQNGANGNRIFAGPATPTGAQIESVVKAAHRAGLAVEIMPIILNKGVFIARKVFQPSQVHRWFSSYRSMIDRWAAVAHKSRANLFCVGSEYDLLTSRSSEWRATIRSVRHRFGGRLTYMATSKNFPTIKWWNALDYASISPYYTLSSARVPTVRALRKQWKPIIDGEYGYYQRFHKPILWDELGYQSEVKTAFEPYAKRVAQPSEQAQANAYQAAIDVTAGKHWLRGVVFYRWDPPLVAANTDISWTPMGKKAECTMAKSWGASTAPKVGGEPTACTSLVAMSR